MSISRQRDRTAQTDVRLGLGSVVRRWLGWMAAHPHHRRRIDGAEIVVLVEGEVARVHRVGEVLVRIEQPRDRGGSDHVLRTYPSASVQMCAGEEEMPQTMPAAERRSLQHQP